MTLYYFHGFSSLSPSASDLEFCRLRLKPSSVVCVLEDKLHGKSLVLKVTEQEMIGSLNSEDHQSNILSPPRMLCQDPKNLVIGFTTLRDLTSMCPTLRNQTLDVLLGISTHYQRQTRNAAIMSIKSWVMPNGAMENLGDRVVSFAVQLLQELEKPEEEEPETIKAEPELAPKIEDVEMEDGETTELEADKSSSDTQITFAKFVSNLPKHATTCTRICEQANHAIDKNFGRETWQNNFTDSKLSIWIRSIDSQSVVNPDGEREAQASIVEVIKSMSASSNILSPRFIIPTIGDLKKAEIMHHVPRIITLLNGSLTERGAIRSVFESIVQQPPSNFGSVLTNVPRVKHSELLTPVELLVLLHRTEEGGYSIKQAIEAIGICFSMTEIFKPEILAAFMQQVVDKLTLPTLFLRTVDSEEDLGSASAMGSIYEMCKDNCTSQFWCPLNPRSIW
ncbi:Symplekin tight junction protein C terminal-domain-containing protein [Phakopsora pachyrhizi]|uniref:Symplekin tight junction protein C terminal-domain-containing protein n=1 Tax=Phakopsora pachyrhizi TaxID=170000 RepID=A0AAV0AD09_PHAPC|nr:Symplekin tight junction protein C terminal-domain-containing protein [Phakopsora pachyrhizi]